MSDTAPHIEVLSAVFQVREPAAGTGCTPTLHVLTHRPADSSDWSLPGSTITGRETLVTAAERSLSGQCGLTRVAHLEQLRTFSDPDRVAAVRTVAATYLGLVPGDVPTDPVGPGTGPDTSVAWHDVDSLPTLRYDHAEIVRTARRRLAAKLSYTNIAFALAPRQFPMSELSEIYGAALGYPVDATNLLRILSRRSVVVATGTVGRTGRSGGRPPALYAFADTQLRVTDEFATLRPPP